MLGSIVQRNTGNRFQLRLIQCEVAVGNLTENIDVVASVDARLEHCNRRFGRVGDVTGNRDVGSDSVRIAGTRIVGEVRRDYRGLGIVGKLDRKSTIADVASDSSVIMPVYFTVAIGVDIQIVKILIDRDPEVGVVRRGEVVHHAVALGNRGIQPHLFEIADSGVAIEVTYQGDRKIVTAGRAAIGQDGDFVGAGAEFRKEGAGGLSVRRGDRGNRMTRDTLDGNPARIEAVSNLFVPNHVKGKDERLL